MTSHDRDAQHLPYYDKKIFCVWTNRYALSQECAPGKYRSVAPGMSKTTGCILLRRLFGVEPDGMPDLLLGDVPGEIPFRVKALQGSCAGISR